MQDIKKLEELARVELSDGEREKCCEEIEKIVSYMNVLEELDFDGTENEEESWLAEGTMREDEILPSAKREEILRNAPRSQNGYFEVPKTVE